MGRFPEYGLVHLTVFVPREETLFYRKWSLSPSIHLLLPLPSIGPEFFEVSATRPTGCKDCGSVPFPCTFFIFPRRMEDELPLRSRPGLPLLTIGCEQCSALLRDEVSLKVFLSFSKKLGPSLIAEREAAPINPFFPPPLTGKEEIFASSCRIGRSLR